MPATKKISLRLDERTLIKVKAPINHIGKIQFDVTPWILDKQQGDKRQDIVGKQKQVFSKVFGRNRIVELTVSFTKIYFYWFLIGNIIIAL